MIGLLPVNSAPVNGAGTGGVLHTMSGSARVEAVIESALPERRRRAVAGAIVRASSELPSMSAERYAQGAALARAHKIKSYFPRAREASGSGLARAHKIMARLGMQRVIGAITAIVRCTASPAAMLVNASYFVFASLVRCAITGTSRPNVIRHAKGYFYNPATATKRTALMSARRWASGSALLRAVPSKSTPRVFRVVRGMAVARCFTQGAFVRWRGFSILAHAVAGVRTAALTYVHSVSGQAVALARKIRASLAWIHRFSALAKVEAIATPPQMVTWMYVYEPDYRTVFVRNDASTTRMRTFRKQPAEVLPYDIDFAEWLAPLHGDDIESAQVHVDSAVNGDPDDLSIDRVIIIIKNPEATQDVEPVRVKVWLSGGVHGATYKITARCDTEGGRRKEVDFRLNVREV